jgi:steroid delta-isomerase-like uncharacterized protein
VSIEENMDVTHRFIDEVVNGLHPENVDQLTAPTYRLYFPGQPAVDREGLLKMAADLKAGFPDFFVYLDDVVAMRDAVAFLMRMTGTHKGTFQGMAATGKKMEVPGQVFFRLKDGKIVEDRPIFDRMTLLEQLGVAPK